ncbi:MAG TPA: CbtA family protein [Acidimicrobiales bacterium]|nr:CbtA family protein [Acidimicrobiales bacterium]
MRFDFTRPRTIVLAALLVGVLAGMVGATFAGLVTEPRVDDAIAIEDRRLARMTPEERAKAQTVSDMATVSRHDQSGPGLFAAYAVAGAAFGLFLAVTSLSLRTTFGGPFRRVALSGLILGSAMTVAPWLKYPPNPPAVGDPATVGERERLYVLMIVLAALILAGAAHLSARLRAAGWPDDRRVVTVAAAGLVAAGVVFAAMPPSPDAVTAPANLVWQFRIDSLVGNLLVWTVLTLGLGTLWAEAQRRAAARAADQNSMPLRAEMPAS